ncbi:hypothetical protein [uncultured Tolumonas sp.]|uniref:hypothetical protein n=1 Tax=uncultured Tolumonas sp. TaxID=263765 RepID=UPI002A0A2060|nr:hypothetical protein [uncultured Tolumonas sp.]
MTTTPYRWTIKNNSAKQICFSLFGVTIGLLFIIGSCHFSEVGFRHDLTIFFLGLIVLSMSAITLLIGSKQIIIIDPDTRQLIFEQAGLYGKRKHSVHFQEIQDYFVDELGNWEGSHVHYFVVAKLKSGEKIPLFLGFYNDYDNKEIMDTYCFRLKEYLIADSSMAHNVKTDTSPLIPLGNDPGFIVR